MGNIPKSRFHDDFSDAGSHRKDTSVLRCPTFLAVTFLLLWVAPALQASAQTITLGETVSGSITAGQEQLYVLENLPVGQRIYIDRTAATNANQLNWLLEDRFGRVLAENLTALNDLGTVTLMGGDYTLTIRGESPTATGDFTFVAVDVVDSEGTLALDVTANGSIGVIGATQGFDLPLTGGGPVRLFFSGVSSNQLSYRLTDALGNLRQDWTTSGPAASPTWHLLDGANRIEVRGRNGFTGSFNLQVRREVEAAPAPLILGGSAGYDSTDVSETDVLSISLASATRVSLDYDYTHANNAGEWRLERSDGALIRDWTGTMNAAAEGLALAAGNYMLKIRSSGATPVSGTVSLLEVIDGNSVLAPDQLATATITVPGQVQRFQLAGVPAGVYLLDQLATDNNSRLNWQIEDALGRAVLRRTASVSDVEDISLLGGDYTLTVLGEGAATGSVDFILVTGTAVDTAVSLGDTIVESISQAGEVRRYTFTAPANRELSIDRLSSSNAGGLNLSLVDAAGRELVSRTTTLPTSTAVSLAGGDYLLTVRGEGGATGDYTLELVNVGPTGFTPSGTALALDTPATATIDTSAAQRWQITLAATTEVYFQLVDGLSNLTWSVFDPSGEPVFEGRRARFPGTDDRGPFVLAAGVYTVELELGSGSPADYEFQAVTVSEPETAIAADTTINGAIAGPGSRQAYLFTVAADTDYYLEILAGASALRWSFEDSAGQPVFPDSPARFANDSQGPFPLAAGDYRLLFDPSGGGTPTFDFIVHAVVDTSEPLVLDAVPVTVSAAMDMPGQQREYVLTVEPGAEQIFVEVVSGNLNLDLTLIDPAGRLLLDNVRLGIAGTDDQGPLVTPPGTYLLQVTTGNPTTSAFEFILHPVSAPTDMATALDQTETLSGVGAGSQARYLLNLADPSTRVFFDSDVTGNARATLTHLQTGWSPFADASLSNPVTADRGPYSLPPGDYALAVNALPNSGSPSWQLRSVVDANAGALTIDQVVDAEMPSVGSRLSYTVTPETDGQSLLFDVMTQASNNTWTLTDPVGTPVFGPVNASSFSSHDRGPFALADGSYELVFSNSSDDAPSWLFRVADASATIEVPEGCAACSALDVVFTFDTSPSMTPVNQTMCNLAGDLIQALADDGIPVSANYWGITQTGSASCLTSNVQEELGATVPGSPPPWMTALDQCTDGGNGTLENWAPAAAVVADGYPWDSDAVRLLIPVADEGSYCGNPVNDFDIDSVYYARDVAIQNSVVISPLFPDIASDPVRALAGLITTGTGGVATIADFDPAQLLPVARSIAIAACGTQQDIALPQFTELSPRPGTLLPSGVPLVISGRVIPVNQLRPVLEIEVNGQPASVLDDSGSFFATIELVPGPNQVTISAVEACGPTVLELELTGAGDESDPWSGFAELTNVLQGRFSGTTFDTGSDRLLVDVVADNPGAELRGPIMMAVGVDLHPGVELLNADGETPNGEPYVVLVPEGGVLPAGGQSPLRELAFSNPGRESIDFQPRWLAPANQPPYFASIPTTRATVSRPWSYTPIAEDGNGDAVTYSLLVAPSGMSLAGNVLSWTPATAGTYDVVLRAADGRGGSSRQSFSVNVVDPGFNAPPVFTSVPVTQAPIGADYEYQAGATDPDGDSVAFALLSAPSGMTVESGTGLVSWDNAAPGQHNVIVEADDGQGGQATQNFTLFVGEPATTPPAPAFVSTPVAFAAVDTQYRYRYRLSPEQQPPPTVTLPQGPAGMVLDTVEQTLTWTPTGADLGPHVVEIVATDGAGQQALQRYTLTVLDNLPNQAPYFTSTPDSTALVGSAFSYPSSAVDPEFEDLTFSLVQAPADMVVDGQTGLVSWTPPGGTPATVTVVLAATDPQGLAAVQEFELYVRADNTAPVVTSTPPAAAVIGSTYTHLFIASDPDGDPLTFNLVQGPSGMNLDAEAGWLSWSTDGSSPGVVSFEIAVDDGWGGLFQQSYDVTLVEDATPPGLAIVIERQPACAGEVVNVCLQASDNVGLASRGLQFDGVPQALVADCVSWTPADPGTVVALATATDVSGLTSNETRNLQVADCNDEQRPVAFPISPLPDDLLTELTPLVATIDDNTPQALTWTVSLRSDQEGAAPQEIANGTGPVNAAEVAMIDATLLPEGAYIISILGSDGVQTGGSEYRINVGSGFKPGRLKLAVNDVLLPLAGIPLSIGRTYDSLEAGVYGSSESDFGPGWGLLLGGSVTDSARESTQPNSPVAPLLAEPYSLATRVDVLKPNGQRVGFTFAPTPKAFPAAFQFDVAFEPDPGVTDKLRAVDGPDTVFALGAGFADYIIPYNPSRFELETLEGVVYVFTESDGLVQIRDALGGVLDVSADGIVSSRGPTIDYQRDAQGRITDILVPPASPGAERGRISYGYDTQGNLVSVTDLAGGVSTYEYGDPEFPHHLTASIDQRGVAASRQVFDDDGRLIAQCPPEGDLATLDGCNEVSYDVAGRSETLFDTRGFRSELFYDEDGLLSIRQDFIDASQFVEQRWMYDDAGRVIEYIDRAGLSTLSTYDEAGNELTRTLPGGRTFTWTYGECGDKWLTATDPLGNTQQQDFDEDCFLVSETDALGGVTSYVNNVAGLPTSRTDPAGQTWGFTYNSLGQVETRTDPSGETITSSYDGLGRLLSQIDRNGQERRFTYDDAGQRLSESWTGTGQSLNWTYNEAGLVTREAGPDGSLDIEYFPTGRIRNLTHANPGAPGWQMDYVHDGNGNVSQVTDSGGAVTRYEYDGLDRMIAVEQTGTGVLDKRVEFDYNDAGLLITVRRFGDLAGTVPGPITDIEYACESCASEPTRIEHRRSGGSTIHELVYTRNAVGQITRLVDAEGTHDFIYDGRGWLINVTHPAIPGLNSGPISYDGMGNWLTLPGRPGPASLSYAAGQGGHRLLSDGAATYVYDDEGNVVERTETASGDSLSLSYDPDGRVVQATLRDDQDAVISDASLGYTPFGARTLTEVDGQRRHFVYDGVNVAAALDDTGQVLWRRLHTRAIDRPLAVDDGSTVQWLLSDHNGSIRDVVDTAGQSLAHFAYTAFGEQVIGPDPSLDDAVRYTGREFDLPGGLGYYRARLYDPAMARFVSEDPVEPWHYRYAENDPLRYSDPTGETATLELIGVLCTSAASISIAKGFGQVVQEALKQAAGGLQGQPGNVDAILEKLSDTGNPKNLLPCGFGELLP